MTKREEYNLEFYKVLNSNNNSINHICKSNIDDSLIHLQFMDQLKKVELEYLIDEIKNDTQLTKIYIKDESLNKSSCFNLSNEE